jgi:heme-degrading monooxygenase HmoA
MLMPVVSITRLRVRSWRFLPVFLLRTVQTARQATTSEGNLGVAMLRDRGNTFWTATSWSSEAAIKMFMRSGVHGPVMRNLLEWCDEAALVHWLQEGPDLPLWEQAHTRIQHEGRRSKVNHPSAAHTAYVIVKPMLGRTRELRLK